MDPSMTSSPTRTVMPPRTSGSTSRFRCTCRPYSLASAAPSRCFCASLSGAAEVTTATDRSRRSAASLDRASIPPSRLRPRGWVTSRRPAARWPGRPCRPAARCTSARLGRGRARGRSAPRAARVLPETIRPNRNSSSSTSSSAPARSAGDQVGAVGQLLERVGQVTRLRPAGRGPCPETRSAARPPIWPPSSALRQRRPWPRPAAPGRSGRGAARPRGRAAR